MASSKHHHHAQNSHNGHSSDSGSANDSTTHIARLAPAHHRPRSLHDITPSIVESFSHPHIDASYQSPIHDLDRPVTTQHLEDLTHQVMPILFAILFFITGTIVLTYSLSLHQPIPKRLTIGLTGSMGGVLVIWCGLWTVSYWKRRGRLGRWHGVRLDRCPLGEEEKGRARRLLDMESGDGEVIGPVAGVGFRRKSFLEIMHQYIATHRGPSLQRPTTIHEKEEEGGPVEADADAEVGYTEKRQEKARLKVIEMEKKEQKEMRDRGAGRYSIDIERLSRESSRPVQPHPHSSSRPVLQTNASERSRVNEKMINGGMAVEIDGKAAPRKAKTDRAPQTFEKILEANAFSSAVPRKIYNPREQTQAPVPDTQPLTRPNSAVSEMSAPGHNYVQAPSNTTSDEAPQSNVFHPTRPGSGVSDLSTQSYFHPVAPDHSYIHAPVSSTTFYQPPMRSEGLHPIRPDSGSSIFSIPSYTKPLTQAPTYSQPQAPPQAQTQPPISKSNLLPPPTTIPTRTSSRSRPAPSQAQTHSRPTARNSKELSKRKHKNFKLKTVASLSTVEQSSVSSQSPPQQQKAKSKPATQPWKVPSAHPAPIPRPFPAAAGLRSRDEILKAVAKENVIGGKGEARKAPVKDSKTLAMLMQPVHEKNSNGEYMPPTVQDDVDERYKGAGNMDEELPYAPRPSMESQYSAYNPEVIVHRKGQEDKLTSEGIKEFKNLEAIYGERRKLNIAAQQKLRDAKDVDSMSLESSTTAFTQNDDGSQLEGYAIPEVLSPKAKQPQYPSTLLSSMVHDIAPSEPQAHIAPGDDPMDGYKFLGHQYGYQHPQVVKQRSKKKRDDEDVAEKKESNGSLIQSIAPNTDAGSYQKVKHYSFESDTDSSVQSMCNNQGHPDVADRLLSSSTPQTPIRDSRHTLPSQQHRTLSSQDEHSVVSSEDWHDSQEPFIRRTLSWQRGIDLRRERLSGDSARESQLFEGFSDMSWESAKRHDSGAETIATTRSPKSHVAVAAGLVEELEDQEMNGDDSCAEQMNTKVREAQTFMKQLFKPVSDFLDSGRTTQDTAELGEDGRV